MATLLSDAQLDRYFERIGFSRETYDPSQQLSFLRRLVKFQLAHIPFENIHLHYSQHPAISLDLDEIYQRIVVDGRGGLCLEVNALFALVLRSLGYQLYHGCARVFTPFELTAWHHLILFITIDELRYLVDVSFGNGVQLEPLLLEENKTFAAMGAGRARLTYQKLEQHLDSKQRLWVYSTQEKDGEPWKEQYAFGEIEHFYPNDFIPVSLWGACARQSYFTQALVAFRAEMDEKTEDLTSLLIIHKENALRRSNDDGNDRMESIETFTTEGQRTEALAKLFGIRLTAAEKKAIRMTVTGLKD